MATLLEAFRGSLSMTACSQEVEGQKAVYRVLQILAISPLH